MPSIDDVFGGTTLKSEDIKGKNPVVTIDNVIVEEFEQEGKKKKKLRIFFIGAKKQLICNSTNAHRIAALHGDDFSMWANKKIKLQVDKVTFAGKLVDGIIVYPPSSQIETGKQAPVREDMDDDIPF